MKLRKLLGMILHFIFFFRFFVTLTEKGRVWINQAKSEELVNASRFFGVSCISEVNVRALTWYANRQGKKTKKETLGDVGEECSKPHAEADTDISQA